MIIIIQLQEKHTVDFLQIQRLKKRKLVLKDRIAHIKNDLEPTTLSLYPELKDVKKYLLSLSPEFVSMTGSGSAFYALFKNKIQLENPFDAWLWQSNIK